MPPQHVPTRSWGTRFDTLPSSPPPLSPPVQESASAVSFGSVSDSSSKRKDDKLPHDASVFVGSLPSNIDHAELTRMLADHLSEHTQINNIKVVRDSKGGVCAFVQCQNAEAASALIQTLHSNEPKPFLGRLLRYEPARAFRTLLVSYRAPIQAIGHRLDHTSQTKDTQVIELALPSAMRMWKPNPSRFFNIIYNGDAVNAEARAAAQADSPLRDISIFLQPVEYNADTIRKLATFFGPLEDFGLYPGVSHDNKAHEDDVTWKSYPVPHNAPRSAVMDKSCWEIKWEHRDDCVSALMVRLTSLSSLKTEDDLIRRYVGSLTSRLRGRINLLHSASKTAPEILAPTSTRHLTRFIHKIIRFWNTVPSHYKLALVTFLPG